MRRLTVLLTITALASLLSAGVAFALTVDCTAGRGCFGTDELDTLNGSAGGDEGSRAYLGAVEDRCPHPDQAPVPHLAAVDDGVVPDHAPLPDRRREPGVGVEDAAVLDVCPGADPDGLRVSPQHGPVPDARVLTEVHVADNERARRDPRGGGELREVVSVREQRAGQIQRRTLPL